MVRHDLVLASGEVVETWVGGRGVPLVIAPGFSAGVLTYAQTLSLCAGLGFKVIAIETASHGGPGSIIRGGPDFDEYISVLEQAIEHLGIKRAVLAGHSMGGRLVCELAAKRPDLAISLLLLDPIVGTAWDKRMKESKFPIVTMAGVGVALMADTMSTAPLIRDIGQAMKLGRLLTPTVLGHMAHPWRVIGPGLSVMNAPITSTTLDRIGEAHVPTIVIHGDRDYVVPLSSARDTALRTNGALVVVRGATHSWLVKDPATLPAIVAELQQGRLGKAVGEALHNAGLNPRTATISEVEGALYAPNALAHTLNPLEGVAVGPGTTPGRLPRYRWERQGPRTKPRHLRLTHRSKRVD